MILLITEADIQAIESFSGNTNFEKKVRPYINKAQEFDVRPLLGEEFWIDLVQNPATYTDLLDSKIYTYNGHTYQHPGLKAVIVEYAYSRYKGEANTHDTPYGLQIKKNEYSDAVPDATVSRQQKNAIAAAEVYWSRVEEYLDRFKSSYPLWRFRCGDSQRPTGNGTRIRKITPNNRGTCHYKRHR